MRNYKMENMELMNMEKLTNLNGKYVFKCEIELSESEKLEFCDIYHNGKVSELLDILKLWEAEKDTLPKEKGFNPSVKTVSFKAWLKRNDKNKIIDLSYNNYEINMLGIETYVSQLSEICPSGKYGDSVWTGTNIINQIFHKLLNQLEIKEKHYFKSIDSFEIKLTQFLEIAKIGSFFECERMNMLIWNGYRMIEKYDITESDLDKWIKSYKELQIVIDTMSENL